MTLLNAFLGGLLLIASLVYFWGSLYPAQVADEHVGKPEQIPDYVFAQGQYEKLRDVAVSCYKAQDELFVARLRATASHARDTAAFFGGVAIVLLLNAWAFRRYRTASENSRSNL
jgi:hypothetical protein